MSKGRPVANKHKVPKDQWRKWSRAAQKLFNDMMYSLRPRMQWVFLHPTAKLMTTKQWRTTRWNAAWVAACCLDERAPLGKVTNVDDRKR